MYQRPAVTQRISYVLRKDDNRNAHLLGVNALALDTHSLTAKLPLSDLAPAKNNVPGGILYTGGRDGMIAAWDLHLESPVPRDIPGEGMEQPKGLPPSTFRQSFNHHTDWVNDIVLCHHGETLVSASSDRTIKLVRPHSHNPTTAHIIGTHEDYVKTLAYASGPGWLASGGLDKTVNLWDIKEGRSGQFGAMGSIPETSSKASIYALACNPAGTVLATGSPEKIIRVWDPRSGQRITKFAGHTDNIRALLISENGDTILSASSDSTIKLWSLTAQRCITTYTMHSDSVWSLYSDHPQLATFYGGGKDGLVTKTEINRYNPQHHHDYDDEDPGQCIVICKADAGVARLVAHDNARIWTATSSSSVYQWPDIPTRANRSAELAASIVPANLLKMNLNESTFTEPVPEQYYPTSTVYSAASLGSLFVSSRDKQSQHSSEDDEGLITPIFDGPENIITGDNGLIKHTVLNNRRQVVTEDKCGEIALWDLIQCVQLQKFTGRKLEDVVNELNTIESVPTWCMVDTRIGALTVHLDEGRCFDAEVYADEVEETPDPERPDDQRIIIGKWVLKNLFENYVPTHIEAYEKELYRQQHPDDPTINPSISVPTTVVTNERNEVVGQAQEGDVVNGRPTINTTSEGLKDPSNEGPKTSPSPTPQDSSIHSQPAVQSLASPQVGGGVTVAPSPTKALLASKTTGPASASSSVPSTPSSFSPTTTSSSSGNGFMGRLKHSVKKLARTPSAEQRFENGRPISSRKTATAPISVPAAAAVASQPLNSPSLPATPTLNSFAASTSSVAGAVPTTPSNSATATFGLGVVRPEDDQSTSDTTSSHSIDSMPSPRMQLPNSTISLRAPHPPFTRPTTLDCPAMVLPGHIPVIISEQSREASSSVDLYRGSVGSLAKDYVPLVQVIPHWLLEVLLKNTIPIKETAKVSFVLRPHHDQEGDRGPSVLGELPGGNPRLTAPRMLRARKVVGHVAEKLNLQPPQWITVSSLTMPVTDAATLEAGQAGRGPLEPVQEEGPHEDSQQTHTELTPTAEGAAVADAASVFPSEGGVVLELAPPLTAEEEAEEHQRQESLKPENWLEILCNDQVLSPTTTLATIRTHYWKTGSDVVLTYRYKLRVPNTATA